MKWWGLDLGQPGRDNFILSLFFSFFSTNLKLMYQQLILFMILSNNIGRSGVVGLIILITAIMYLGSLKWLFNFWLNNEAYSQGFLIPIISAVLIWKKRDVSHREKESKSPVLFIISLIIYITGLITGAIFITTISLIPLIFEIILLLKGMDALKAVAFPILGGLRCMRRINIKQ